jgi:hypothetical protein
MRILILFCFIFSACHIQTRQVAGSAKSDGRLGQALNGSEVILIGTSLTAAKQICQSLSAKEVFFRQNYLTKKFRLRALETDCSKNSKANDFDAILDSVNANMAMFYRPQIAVSFYQYEDSSKFGVVSEICTKIMKGDTVTDTIISGNIKSVYSFSTNRVKIEFATKDFKNINYIKDKTVELQINQNGVISPRTETSLCGNGASLIMNQSILSLPD